jgi:AcrR family transcriptional regulator
MLQYWREGVHTLSLNEVCRRISVSKPLIYREFGSEDAFIDSVLGHYHDAVVGPVLAFLSTPRPLTESLEGLVIGMTTPRAYPPGCLFTQMRLLRPGLGPQTLARVDAIEAQRRAAFESLYADALTRGEANPALSARSAAQYLDAQVSMTLLHVGMGHPLEHVRTHARLALSVLTATP